MRGKIARFGLDTLANRVAAADPQVVLRCVAGARGANPASALASVPHRAQAGLRPEAGSRGRRRGCAPPSAWHQ